LVIIIRIISIAVLVGGLLPVVVGFAKYRSLNTTKRLILTLMGCSLIASIVQYVLAIQKIPNLFIGHFYVLLEFVLLAYIYRLTLKQYIHQAVFSIINIGFICFSLLNAFHIQGLKANNSYQRTLEAVIVIAWILMYFYKTLKELKVQQIEREPMFWFSGGALIFFAGTIFIYIFSNYLLQYSAKLAIAVWAAHAFFLLLFYISAAIALWINPKK